MANVARLSVRRHALPFIRTIRHYSCAKDESPTRLRIYTRTGDKGKTSNFAGQRLPKDDVTFEALGTTDELSCAIGLASEFSQEAKHDLSHILQDIQCILQEAASHIATPRSIATEKKLAQTEFSAKHVDKLEHLIDKMEDELPPLKNFILPSGGKTSASLHLARSICRRAERKIVPLYREGEIDQEVFKYINRLSDFLFVAARYTAKKEGKDEVIYHRVDSTD